MERIESICSFRSRLFFDSICSLRIRNILEVIAETILFPKNSAQPYKGLLALEGELAPILVQMVKSANTNGLLDNESDELHEFAGE